MTEYSAGELAIIIPLVLFGAVSFIILIWATWTSMIAFCTQAYEQWIKPRVKHKEMEEGKGNEGRDMEKDADNGQEEKKGEEMAEEKKGEELPVKRREEIPAP
eukprot:CAMPEP_0114493666 /NCGR_PEP_ID=MMETSP0109-20121206/4228_1 /TAXON_ID=29199 /ORGANISM="Chlorarachnion reptans, Strain CCCM449" /LENGTH=102 /DNA_ID=CAMNT_0001670627 /DNA_START=32 /DNA_END=340 /DNA_ORIENTATION=+